MKDDPREVDWAPNQIKDLKRRMAALEGFLGKASDSEMFEEGGTAIEAFEQQNRRANSLSQRILDQGKRHTELKKNLEERIARLDRAAGERMSALERRVVQIERDSDEVIANGRRLAKLENGVASLSEQSNVDRGRVNDILSNYVPEAAFEDLVGRVRRLEGQTQFEITEDDARIKALEKTFNRFREVVETALHNYGIPIPQPEDKTPQFGAPWSNDEPLEFSPPIGQDPSVESWRKTITGAAAMRQEAFIRGFSAGGGAAISGAERRVRQMMTNHFSEATICEVLKAVRGEGL